MPDDDLTTRIESMYAGDRTWALTLVALLWVAIGFVLFMTWPLIPDGYARTLALIAGAALLLFNTASIIAMLSHYDEDKAAIYGLDIKYLDAMRDPRK